MVCYGKTASHAVSAMSYLASIYYQENRRVGSAAVSRARSISKPLVAKILTILSTAALVSGVPGPNGGYTLAREPKDISLFDIVTLFERLDDKVSCPFGPEWCGNGPACPIHDEILALKDENIAFLKRTNLSVFVADV